MLRERVLDLIERYENPEDEFLTAGDVQEELEDILYEEFDEELSYQLYDALRNYVLDQYYASRGGGRIPDGSDEFIAAVERIIGYNDGKN